MATYWGDTSQYQGAPIDETYPHPFFSFRTNSGNATDTLAIENGKRALALLKAGKLRGVFPYYFFRPGEANCDLHRKLLEQCGLWGHPLVATMIDVEDANGQYRSDMSEEINDEYHRLGSWYGDQKRVFGYLNGVANRQLWRDLPAQIKLVTPSYSGRPGVWATPPPPGDVLFHAFAQQFTDSAMTKPWSRGTDLNYSVNSVEEIQAMLGLKEGSNMGVVEDGAGQLSGHFGNVRKPVNKDSVQFLPKSFNPETDPNGPAANDMWAATVNEVVWDGYSPFGNDHLLASNNPRSLVALVQTLLAQVNRLEQTVNQLAGK